MSAINIFVSYSHEDARWVQPGEFGLIPWLAHQLEEDDVQFWVDYELKKAPGIEFQKKIEAEIDQAQFAVLLISQDFVNSKFIRQIELKRIKERLEREELSILPILVGPTSWKGRDELKWLSERQMMPGQPTPLIDYTESPIKWQHVRVEILEAIQHRVDEKRKARARLADTPAIKPEHVPEQTSLPASATRTNSITSELPTSGQQIKADEGIELPPAEPRESSIVPAGNATLELPLPNLMQEVAAASAPLTSEKLKVMGASVAAIVLVLLLVLVGRAIWRNRSAVSTSVTEDLSNRVKLDSASFTEDLGNGVKLEMIAVPGGTFQMGSENGNDNEKPVHQVTVAPFAMGKYEVTQAQWQAVMGNNPSYFKGEDLPVEMVSWEDAVAFCQKLTAKTHKSYRLPTEAEWEYACRARTTGDYAGNLDEMAWYGDNAERKTQPVGQKIANAFGLYDLHGNVWEWCEDVWHDSYGGQHGNPPTDRSAWVTGGDPGKRVLRGGAWLKYRRDCRSASRLGWPSRGDRTTGFRVVMSARTP